MGTLVCGGWTVTFIIFDKGGNQIMVKIKSIKFRPHRDFKPCPACGGKGETQSASDGDPVGPQPCFLCLQVGLILTEKGATKARLLLKED